MALLTSLLFLNIATKKKSRKSETWSYHRMAIQLNFGYAKN